VIPGDAVKSIKGELRQGQRITLPEGELIQSPGSIVEAR
jgi:hypothetical protein